MSAALAMKKEEEPRLYSTRYIESPAIDAVPDHQREIHAELERWARWCWEKWRPNACESIEHEYDPGEGGRQAKAPVVALPENPRMRAIDGVIRHMRMHQPAHGEALRLFYAGERPRLRDGGLGDRYRPCPWWVICRAVHIPRNAFPGFMVIARASVLNLLRRVGV